MKIILHNTTTNNEKMDAHIAKCYIDKMNEFLAGELDDDLAAKWISPYQFIDIITNLKMQNQELRERLDTLEEIQEHLNPVYDDSGIEIAEHEQDDEDELEELNETK